MVCDCTPSICNYCLSLFLAAVRVQYPSATESQINSKIDAFLAQSGDRDGGEEKEH